MATTAQQVFETYKDALHNGWLRQGVYNGEEDGRRVACALGVIGPDVNSASQCPATVMPSWLAKMVPWLFDCQAPADAFAWGEKFYAELARLDGKVPFEVVYDWHARYSTQMGIEAAEKRGRDPGPAKALQELHTRAAAGDRADRETWYKVLRNAYAYADADAYAYAYANADADAYANANANANANAYANANANANAYANANANAYADAYAYAYADAYAYAYANADADAYAYAYADAYAYARKMAITRLALGLVECMSRVTA